ncbi:hypothetical protein [Paenibacillus oceani]|uniref:Uncharacterized protein n=1 Tax=Paenibacillus oceani TaxID=2772510 RepID=A0A927C4V1_9BACL|nr:hypothetical protein [Paenibacillus oceani]MBD2860844.1 hypothetical protein [Paenibacillus oceani]
MDGGKLLPVIGAKMGKRLHFSSLEQAFSANKDLNEQMPAAKQAFPET